MTVTEVNLIMIMFFNEHQGKRLCDVVTDSNNTEKIYGIYKTNNTIKITMENDVVLMFYSIEEELFYYYDTSVTDCDQIKREVNLLDYISFEDKV